MSIASEILAEFTDEVASVRVDKDAKLHGEDAIEVTAVLSNKKVVTGTFTSHPKSGFGGVEFSGPKNVVGLMVSKINSVLEGKAE